LNGREEEQKAAHHGLLLILGEGRDQRTDGHRRAHEHQRREPHGPQGAPERHLKPEDTDRQHTPTQPSASETDLAIAWIQNLITPSSPSQSQISPQPLLKKDQLPYTVLPWKKVTSGSTTQLVSALQITHSVTDPVQGRFVVLVKTQQSLEVYPASALSFIKNIKIDPLQAEDFSVSKFREIKFNLSLNPVSATKNNTEIDTLIFSKEHQLIAIDHQKI
jgi:hypothetical protein